MNEDIKAKIKQRAFELLPEKLMPIHEGKDARLFDRNENERFRLIKAMYYGHNLAEEERQQLKTLGGRRLITSMEYSGEVLRLKESINSIITKVANLKELSGFLPATIWDVRNWCEVFERDYKYEKLK